MALADTSNIPQVRGQAHVIDTPSREWAEQEQLRRILAQFYSISQPEEEKVSIQLFYVCFIINILLLLLLLHYCKM